jgi:hypothetical protein
MGDSIERARILELIEAGNASKALDLAKDLYRRFQTDASEALLIDAYCARMDSLVASQLTREAIALFDMLRGRYPSYAARLDRWKAESIALKIRLGDLSSLLAPLNDPSLAAERQSAIADQVRRDVFDLPAVADCAVLAAEHPLRVAAAALHRAFVAVTTGPVNDDALALPEVSRSNPLAPWKMLVRAIAAYYRREDALCEKCLAAIDPVAAPARLIPALRSLLRQPQKLTPAATVLVSKAGPSLGHLRQMLNHLDQSFEFGKEKQMLGEIRSVVEICRKTHPAFLDRLKQHISIRASIARVKADKVTAALGGPTLKNAYMWRLLARAEEEKKDNPLAIGLACSYWEEFRKHAIREGWFPAQGPEVAALYLHMADQLRQVGPDDLDHIRYNFQTHFDNHESYYKGQRPEIQALKPDPRDRSFYYLSPSRLLEQACEADPSPQNFQRWLETDEQIAPLNADRVAERWLTARPTDIPPLLHLMHSAEKRNALQKAFKLMEQAEKIDGVNAEVRRARLRLLVSIARRHLRENKANLAAKDLQKIEQLSQAQQADRPAFVAALRYVLSALRGLRPEADAAFAETARLLGDGTTAYLLILNVEQWCGRPGSALGDAPKPTVPLFAAFGRACAVGADFGLIPPITPGMAPRIENELSVPGINAEPRILAALAEAANQQDQFPLAYTVSGVGLRQSAESRARFLYLRAESIPPWERDRRSSCLAAARELARHQHDTDLLRRIGELRTRSMNWVDEGPAKSALGAAEIQHVVEREIGECSYPNSRPPLRFENDEGLCPCPDCTAKRGELLPDMPEELRELIDQLGPDVVAGMLDEMLNSSGGGGSKKRGRRSRILDDDDVPF